jgi:hypothetical protein
VIRGAPSPVFGTDTVFPDRFGNFLKLLPLPRRTTVQSRPPQNACKGTHAFERKGTAPAAPQKVMKMKMHPIQFALIVNLIQMKSMKVIHNRQDMMNQEFQHCSESRLIEVMKMKMHPIQFAVIVNLIQMKSMKVIHTRKNMMNQEFQYHEEL